MPDKSGRNDRLIEALVDILGDSEGQTADEVKAELASEGVDVYASVKRLMATVRRCSTEAKMRQLDLAKERRLAREVQRPSVIGRTTGLSGSEIDRRLEEIDRITEGRLCVNFRDLEAMSEEDKKALLEDMELALSRLEPKKDNDA